MNNLVESLKNAAKPDIFKSGWMAELLAIDGMVLAGGSIRDSIEGVKPKDYDFFFTRDGVYERVSILLHDKMEPIEETAYTETFRGKGEESGIVIQLIFKTIFADKHDVIKDFDFTATQFAMDKSGLVMGPTSLQDVLDKKVKINVITKPLSSLNRLVKYHEMKYDCKEAYDYIISVMQTQPHGVILGSENSYYNGEEESENS